MIPGETVRTGAEWPGTPLRILQSNAGWYLGYLDRFGEPYTRETHYYPDRASVVDAIDNSEVAWRE